MPTSSVEASSKEEDDTVELARFRQEWLTELQRRKASTATGTGTTTFSAELTQQSNTKEPIRQTSESAPNATSSRGIVPSRRNLATHPALNEDGRIASSSQISKALESALNIYRRAVAHEQRGELDQAILLYRQAFRLVCGCIFTMEFNTSEMLLG